MFIIRLFTTQIKIYVSYGLVLQNVIRIFLLDTADSFSTSDYEQPHGPQLQVCDNMVVHVHQPDTTSVSSRTDVDV